MKEEQERRRPEDVPERRDYTPPGRFKRIVHDYRGPALGWIGVVVGCALLFAATSAWAVNERYMRRVSEMSYLNDVRSLQFVRQQEAQLVDRMRQRERTLAERERELAPSGRPYLVVSLAERKVAYLRGDDTIFAAPVAVGSGKTLVLGGRTKRFSTPRG